MTGQFTLMTPEQASRCQHYASFMQHLQRSQADWIFGLLFIFMIVLLITASTMYTKSSETLCSPEEELKKYRIHRKVRRKCLIVSLICFALAIPTLVFEALAALSIQFCDGEDLMMFYWGFWTLLQVGSVIAILGISLNQCYSLQGKCHPPWNVALGTPVLVIAAVGHWCHFRIRSYLEQRNPMGNDRISRRSMSESSAMPRGAKFLGNSLNNETAIYAVPLATSPPANYTISSMPTPFANMRPGSQQSTLREVQFQLPRFPEGQERQERQEGQDSAQV